ncbi:MAG: alpha/beta hydrolase [Rhodospirillales bacterium]|nr:MAG: alpha/beta hydrolase [Rhodospirillales bacterium]
MKRLRIALSLALALSAPAAARAVDLPTDEAVRVFALGPVCRALYERYRGAPDDRAFAVNSKGKCGFARGATTPDAVRARALEFCGGEAVECRIVATNLATERDGTAPLVVDRGFTIRGAATAAGVVIWNHGTLSENATRPPAGPPPLLRPLAAEGWDVYRVDRPGRGTSRLESLGMISQAVQRARAMGYKRIMLAGQSAGGWAALELAGKLDGIDAALATAPARHGKIGTDANLRARALREFDTLLGARPRGGARLVIALFENDEYDADAAERARIARGKALSLDVPLLLIDRPDIARGHGGGLGPAMAGRYGRCVRDYLARAAPPPGVATCGE